MTTPRLLVLFLSCCVLSAASFWTVDRWLQASPYDENDTIVWEGFLEYEGRPFDGTIPMVVHVRGHDGSEQVYTQSFDSVTVHGGLFRVVLGCTGAACSENEVLPRWATTQQNVRIEAQLAGELLSGDHRTGTVPLSREADRYGTLLVRGGMNIAGSLTAPSLTTSSLDVGGALSIADAFDAGPSPGSDPAIDIDGSLFMPAGTLQAEEVRLQGSGTKVLRNPAGTSLRFAAGTDNLSAAPVLSLDVNGSALDGVMTADRLSITAGDDTLEVFPRPGNTTRLQRASGDTLTMGSPASPTEVDSSVSIGIRDKVPGFSVSLYEPGFSGATSSTFGNADEEICWLGKVALKPNEISRSQFGTSSCRGGANCGQMFACTIERSGSGYRFRRDTYGGGSHDSVVRACGAVCLTVPGGF